MQAGQDFAVVIGIERYDDPGFSRLKGAPEDAREFILWLEQNHSQGDLRRGQILQKLTEATHTDIVRVLNELLDKAEANRGGRLYIFVSGHGFGESIKESFVYLSEHTRRADACFDLVRTADALRYSGLFKEIVVFVDCCRHMKRISATGLPLKIDQEDAPATYFYCFSCFFGVGTSESQYGSRSRGLFSLHLLRALNGLAANAVDHRGRVTAYTLVRHLSRRLTPNGNGAGPDFEPRDPQILRNLILASGFEPQNRSLKIHLADDVSDFGLFSGDERFAPLDWSYKPLGGQLFQVEREDDSVIVVTAPKVADPGRAKRSRAVAPDETYIEI